MTTHEMWVMLRPVTRVTWGLFAFAMLSLAWIVRQRAHVPPAFVKLTSRNQRAMFWLFVMTVLLFWWDGAPWQGVEFYARTFLPLWLVFWIAEVTFSWCARRQ